MQISDFNKYVKAFTNTEGSTEGLIHAHFTLASEMQLSYHIHYGECVPGIFHSYILHSKSYEYNDMTRYPPWENYLLWKPRKF